jgi:hypothetical protein
MARPRTPTEVLSLKGAFKKHPERKDARKGEPRPSGELGDPPAFLSPQQAEIWLELANICPPRVLTNADRWTVEIAVRLMAKVRDESITNGQLAQLIVCLSRMGMTPSDRSKIGIPENAEEENPFEEIARETNKPN